MAMTTFQRLKGAFKSATYDVFAKYYEEFIFEKRYTETYNDIERIAEKDIMSIRDGNITYDDIESMMNDSQVFIGIKMRQLSVVGIGGVYENKKFPHIADHINNCLRNMDVPFENYIELLLDCIPYGWKSMEKIWDIVDGMPVLKGFVDHIQEITEIYMKDGGGLPTVDYFENYGSKIPGKKCLYMVYDQKNKAPHGKSGFDPIYKNWFMKDKFLKYEAMFLERMGIPPIIVKIKGYNTGNLNKAYKIINKLHKESGVPIDQNWDIELLETAKKGDSYFSGAIEYHDQHILRGLLFPSGVLDEGKSGTYGAADIRFEILKWVIERDRSGVRHVLETQLFNEWVAYINPNAVSHGKWSWKPYQELDWVRISEGIKDLVDAQVLNPDIDTDYIRENWLKIPSMKAVDEMNIKNETKDFLKNVKKVPSTVYRNDAMVNAKNDTARVKIEKENIENAESTDGNPGQGKNENESVSTKPEGK